MELWCGQGRWTAIGPLVRTSESSRNIPRFEIDLINTTVSLLSFCKCLRRMLLTRLKLSQASLMGPVDLVGAWRLSWCQPLQLLKEFQPNKTLEIHKNHFLMTQYEVFSSTCFWVRLGWRYLVEASAGDIFELGVSTCAQQYSAYPIRLRISLGPVQWDNTSKVQNTAAYRPIRDHTKGHPRLSQNFPIDFHSVL